MKKFILKLFKIKSEEEIRKDERCKVIKEMLEDKEEYEHFVSIIFLYGNGDRSHRVGRITSETPITTQEVIDGFVEDQIEKDPKLKKKDYKLESALVIKNYESNEEK
jgi:hypothetical protein